VVQEPVGIPASEVPRRADETRARLRQIRAGLPPPGWTEKIEETLTDMESVLSDLEKNPNLHLDTVTSLRALDDLQSSALGLKVRIEESNRILEDRAGKLDDLQKELDSLRNLWERTRVELLAEGAAPGLIQEPDSVLFRADRLGKELTDRLSTVQSLQGKLSSLSSRTQSILDEVAATPARTRLFHPERPPLWKEIGARPDSTGHWTGMKRSWNRYLASLPSFLHRNRTQLWVQLACFLILAGLIMYAGRRSRGTEGEPLPVEARTILERPISAAFLATLLLTRPLHPYAPSIVFVINTTLAVIPLLRLLPRMVPPSLRNWIWGLGGLFVLGNLTNLLGGDSVLYRIDLLVLILLAQGGALLMLRSRTLMEAFSPRGAAVLKGLLRLAITALGAAILADVVGSVTLATVVTESVLWSFYLIMIAIALVGVLDGMVHVALRSWPLDLARSVRDNLPLLQRRARKVVRFGITVVVVVAMLRILRISNDVMTGLSAILTAGFNVGAVRIDFGTALLFLAVLWLSTLLSRFIRFILGEDLLPRLRLPLGVPQTITQLVHYAIITIGFLLAVASTGFDLTRLTILAGALGVGVGFGLQTVVNNFVSGLILMVERPVRIGDTVEIGTLMGRVKRIGIRASIVRTFSGAEVVVPNGSLIAGNLVNWTLSDPRRRVELPVGVAYGSDVDRVRELLLEVAREHPECLKEPEPVALFLGFGDSSLNFELRFWTLEDFIRVKSEVTVGINKALIREKIEIPFPQRDVHLVPPPAAKEEITETPDT